jgi:uncharacterized Zn-binding protein involved in type VI secretion
MAKLSRVGDMNQSNGTILRGASTVFANGIKVGLHVSSLTPDTTADTTTDTRHSSSQTTEGSPSVFAEGVAVLRIGSGTTCGHSIVTGSSDVYCP